MKSSNIKKAIVAFAFLAIPATLLAQSEGPSEKGLLGRWEARLYDKTWTADEGEILLFQIENGRFKGVYLGLERVGEHGLFYSAVGMKDLAVVEDGEIRFTVPGRSFYVKRPMSLAKAKSLADNGGTRGEMRYHGRLVKTRLLLKCESNSGECPSETLEFQKGKWIHP